MWDERRVPLYRIRGKKPFTFYERIVHGDGSLVVPDDIASWTLRIFEVAPTPQQAKAAVTVDGSSGFEATLQTDEGWDVDSDGWNFKYTVTSDLWHREFKLYRFELRFETGASSTGPIYLDREVQILPEFSNGGI